MTKITVDVDEDDLGWYRRLAGYRRVDVSEVLSAELGTRRRSRRGSMTVEVPATDLELGRWQREAHRRGFYLDEWMRRMANFVSTTHVTEGHTFTRHGDDTALWVGTCAWCNDRLPEHCSKRRVFCSDVCRVQSWRASQSERADDDAAYERT